MSDWLAEIVKVVLLGVVEGVTEFLPISSTGHLVVATSLLNLTDSLDGVFEIFIQIGAVFAVIWYYRHDFWLQAQTIREDRGVQRLWGSVAIAFIPTAFLGFRFGPTLRDVLFNPLVIASALIFGGVIFLVVEYLSLGDEAEITELTEITARESLIVGLLQALALIPGMSRSGVSIIAGMLAGVDRKTSTQFSFYLAVPTLLGATLYDLARSWSTLSISDLGLLFLGAVVSAVIAWLSIRWLLQYISNNSFVLFGYYRIFIGIVIVILSNMDLL